jgi:YD repeat-containing protein
MFLYISKGFIKATSVLVASLFLFNSVFAEGDRISDANLVAGLSQQFTSNIDVETTSGAFTYKYTLDVPKGRQNMTPDVFLVYNNQNIAHDSIFGYGWSLSIPYIKRINKYGVETMYTRNDFESSVVGELEIISSNEYGARVDNGSFVSFVYENNFWVAKDKIGVTYIYGETQEERQEDTANPENVYKWFLSSTIDTNGNQIKYVYDKSQGQIYPSEIRYTGANTEQGIYKISFLREMRTDISTSYESGFRVETNERIKEVQVFSNDNWIKKYDFSYGIGSNGYRSLLSSVTQSTKGSSGDITVLKPIEFFYSQNTPSWEESEWSIPTIPYMEFKYSQFADLNGDAYIDMLFGYENENYPYPFAVPAYRTWINNTENGMENMSPNLLSPVPFTKVEFELCGWGTGTENSQGVLLMDINGDLHTDIIQNLPARNGANINNFFATSSSAFINNNGEEWLFDENYIPELPIEIRCANEGYSSVGDLNGDRLLDIVNYQDGIQYNLGESFSEIKQRPEPIFFANNSMMGDVNGDGLDDSLIAHVDKRKTSINTGTNVWFDDSNWATPDPVVFYSNMEGDQKFRLMDINSDGLLDLVQVYQAHQTSVEKTFLNTGNGWVYSPEWKAPEMNDNKIFYMDINADGLVDFFYSGGNSGGVTQVHVLLNKGTIPDKLEKIITSEGGEIDVTYKPSTQYRDVEGNILNDSVPFIIQTVEDFHVLDPISGTESEVTYEYANGDFYYGGAHDRKFAGFGKVTTSENGERVTTEYFHQGNGDDTASGESGDDYGKIGKVYRKEVSDASGDVYQTELTRWKTDVLGSDRYLVTPERAVTLLFDGNASHRDTAETYVYDTANGNLLEATSWGEVSADAVTGDFADVGDDKTTTVYTYAENVSENILGLPSTETLYDADGSTKLAENRYYYDNLLLGEVSLGNMTKEEAWLDTTGGYVSTERTYNNYGLMTSQTDSNGNTTQYVYDAYNLYPQTVTNALGHETHYTYDYASGKVQEVTDPNGTTLKNTYDGFGRVVKVEQTAQDGTTLVTKEEYTYDDLSQPRSVYKKEYLANGSNPKETYEFYDGLGRLIQSRTSSDEAGKWSVQTLVYDALGRAVKEYVPFESASSAYGATAQSDMQATVYEYDILDRPTKQTTSLGETTTNYDNWSQTVTDAKANVKEYVYDARNNLVQVSEHNGADEYVTNYRYDNLNNLVHITDAESNVRGFTYDSLGRQLSSELPHKVSATASAYAYAYDANGNKTGETHPDGHTVQYTYDALNRMLSKDDASTSGTDVVYTFDTAPNGIGKVATEETADQKISYEYDKQGNVTREERMVQEALLNEGAGGGGTVPVEVDPVVIYDEALASNWYDWSWNSTQDYAGTEYVSEGSYATKVEYTSNWGAFHPQYSTLLEIGDNDTLSFDVLSPVTRNAWDVQVELTDASDGNLGYHQLVHYMNNEWMQPEVWYHVEIPISELNPTNAPLGGATFQAAFPMTLYFDNIALTKKGSDVVVYDDQLQAGWYDWSWNSTRDYFKARNTYRGHYATEVVFETNWAGFHPQHPSLDIGENDTYSFAILSPVSRNAWDVYLQLTDDTDGNLGYVPLVQYMQNEWMEPNVWYRVEIPLSELNPTNAIVGGVTFQTAFPMTLYFDDIAFTKSNF